VLTPHTRFSDEPLWDNARVIVDTRHVVPGGPTVHQI
jgi:hypothetical protein